MEGRTGGSLSFGTTHTYGISTPLGDNVHPWGSKIAPSEIKKLSLENIKI
jgi:hypothetical protein